MKFLLFLTLILGCSPKTPEISKVCLDGHVYFKYANQLAIKLTDDGKPINCEKNELTNSSSIDQNLVKLALDWIKMVDEKKFDQSWELAAPFFKNAITKEEWAKAASLVDKRFGKIIKREPIETLVSGDRAEVRFKSDYLNLSATTETLSLINANGKWSVIGYTLK
jgi:hypothetical protein